MSPRAIALIVVGSIVMGAAFVVGQEDRTLGITIAVGIVLTGLLSLVPNAFVQGVAGLGLVVGVVILTVTAWPDLPFIKDMLAEPEQEKFRMAAGAVVGGAAVLVLHSIQSARKGSSGSPLG